MIMVRERVHENQAGRILFVEEDPDTCELVRLILGDAGYEVKHATTVAEGLSLTQQEQFDLVLLDSYFDDGTGLELCQAIRAANQQTPIFFYTGLASEKEINAALKAGAQGCFIKPVESDHLLSIIALHLSRKNERKALA